MCNAQGFNVGRIEYMTEDSIVLDNYLDVLMNVKACPVREVASADGTDKDGESWSRLTKYGQYNSLRETDPGDDAASAEANRGGLKYWGGIMLPRKRKSKTEKGDGVLQSDPGSGNMVIIGEPGVGKTTLAFQIAVSCMSDKNNGIAVYYSLSTPRTQLIDCMRYDPLDGRRLFNRPGMISGEPDINDNDEMLLEHFMLLLSEGRKDTDGKPIIKPQVFFPSLSPKGLSSDTPQDSQRFFRQRFHEIEMMLRTVKLYNAGCAEARRPKVKAVILDSLNDFNISPLTKVEVSKLFELFEHYGILGIFTLAENQRNTREELIIEDAVRYDADTILHLKRVSHKNYMCSLISVAKSRYVRAVIGEHVYKIQDRAENDRTYSCMSKHLVVLPSLHHVIIGSAQGVPNLPEQPSDIAKNIFGIRKLDYILPPSLLERQSAVSQIVTLKGNSGLFKSDLAVNALLYGMTRGNNGMIIHLSERNLLKNGDVRLETSVHNYFCSTNGAPVFEQNDEYEAYLPQNPNKRDISCWKWNGTKIFELVFRSGALLPEEFMEDVLTLVRRERIRTIAFTDVKDIGASYPFLIDSRTSGDLFLSAFIHIMRNMGVNLITTSSDTGFEPSDNEMRKIAIMSDAVLEFRLEEEQGTKMPYVTLTGEGSIIAPETGRSEIRAIKRTPVHDGSWGDLRLKNMPLFEISEAQHQPK